MKKLILIVLSILITTSAVGAVTPIDTPKDPRIKKIVFTTDDVVELKTHFFRYTMIEFAEHESIETHFIGDPEAWEYEERGHRIFIKPLLDTPNTNMTVITDKRTYFFKLIGQKKWQRKTNKDTETFALKFLYPKEKTRALERKAEAIAQLENQTVIPGHTIDPKRLNHAYGYKGDDALKPIQIFDDGVFTYFQFGEHQTIPAIFYVDNVIGGENREQLVNYHHRGNYLVVERVGSQFALRVDDQLICIFNKNIYKNTSVKGNHASGKGS
jgi:type IV secretion system protein VirB9